MRFSFKRRSEVREIKKFLYIFTEGKKTEPNYFNAKKKELRNQLIKVVINPPGVGGMCTMGLVDAAIKYIADNNINSDPTAGGDSCWVVFDYDDFNTSFDNAISRALAHGLKVAYSNDSFELWYVLHFREYSSPAGRKDYIKILNDLVPGGYHKNSDKMYPLIQNDEQTAIGRAKRLEKDQAGVVGYSKRNPSTRIFALVEELNLLK